jgi:hypothetical protein
MFDGESGWVGRREARRDKIACSRDPATIALSISGG